MSKINLIGLLSIGVCGLLISKPVSSQEMTVQDRIQLMQATAESYNSIIRTACVSGEGEVISLKVDGGGDLFLTFKGIRPGVEGNIDLAKQTTNGTDVGSIGFIDEELRLKADAASTQCFTDNKEIFVELLRELKNM